MKAALAAETKLRQSLETELATERERRQRELGASTSSQSALDEVRVDATGTGQAGQTQRARAGSGKRNGHGPTAGRAQQHGRLGRTIASPRPNGPNRIPSRDRPASPPSPTPQPLVFVLC